MQTILRIENLELMIHLGVTEAERAVAQKVLFNIEIHFDSLMQAAHTDVLTDTICYASIEQNLRAAFERHNFNLIEHLGYRCYELLKNSLAANIQLKLSVTKFLGLPHGSRTFVLG